MSYFSFNNYDFSHLDAFSLNHEFEDKNKILKTININIEFGFHCFTNDIFYYKKNIRYAKDNINPINLIIHENETREFDLIRYEQSMLLPNLIKKLFSYNANVCFNTAKTNKGKEVYFRKEEIEYNCVTYEYYIFFNSTKDKHVLFYVTSAYHREDEYYKQFSKSKIKLNTIIRKTLE